LQLAVGGSRSALCDTINRICNKYDIEKVDLLTRRIDSKGMWHYRNDENLVRKGDQIRELLEIRGYGCDFLTRGVK
jgi:hypothetical protein